MPKQWGAPPQCWDHFDLVLGLTEDLLPVVSNLEATIDPKSKMKELGKTPSRYNAQRNAVGIPEWTMASASKPDWFERSILTCLTAIAVIALLVALLPVWERYRNAIAPTQENNCSSSNSKAITPSARSRSTGV